MCRQYEHTTSTYMFLLAVVLPVARVPCVRLAQRIRQRSAELRESKSMHDWIKRNQEIDHHLMGFCGHHVLESVEIIYIFSIFKYNTKVKEPGLQRLNLRLGFQVSPQKQKKKKIKVKGSFIQA